MANVHFPAASVVAVLIPLPPCQIFSLLLASAVPVRIKVLVLVMPSPTTPVSGLKLMIVGARGAVPLTVTFKAVEAGLILPAAYVDGVVKE